MINLKVLLGVPVESVDLLRLCAHGMLWGGRSLTYLFPEGDSRLARFWVYFEAHWVNPGSTSPPTGWAMSHRVCMAKDAESCNNAAENGNARGRKACRDVGRAQGNLVRWGVGFIKFSVLDCTMSAVLKANGKSAHSMSNVARKKRSRQARVWALLGPPSGSFPAWLTETYHVTAEQFVTLDVAMQVSLWQG